MLEDVLYEILPVVGFATILSAVFVLAVMWKAKRNPRIFMFFAVSDIINGVAFVVCGFYGVFVTMSGIGNEQLHPSFCLFHAPHLLLWAYTDATEVLCILLFLFDRTLQILVPTRYGKISKSYLTLKFGLILFATGTMGFIPTFFETITANSTVTVPKLCRFEQVVLPDFYDLRLMFVEWLPVFGMLWTVLVFLVYLIRQSKQRWSYNWTEEIVDTKQMIALAFLRCLFTEAAVRMILINVQLTNNANEIVMLRDFLLRAALALLVSVLSPGIYMLISTPFADRVGSTFNAYGKNTERKWQSADDPPPDINMEKAEFGSWYSTTGNIRGDAGVPMEERAEKERSASFYFDSPPIILVRFLRSFSRLFLFLLGRSSNSTTMLFFKVLTPAEVENGGCQFEQQNSMGIEWRVGLEKATVNEKEMLRATIQGTKNNNNNTASTWRTVIETNLTVYDKNFYATRKRSPRLEIDSNSVCVLDFIEWDVLVNPYGTFVKDNGTIQVYLHLTVVDSVINTTNVDVNTRKRKIDLSTRSPLTDFALVVEGIRIYVGRQFLATHSPVFNTMFYGDFAEKDKDEVELKDVNYEDFMSLLDQLYPNSPPLDDSDVEGLIKLADQFEVESVLSRVETFLIDSNSIPLSKKLLLSDRYRLARLKGHCLTKLNDKEAVRKLSKSSEYKALPCELKVQLLEVFVRD